MNSMQNEGDQRGRGRSDRGRSSEGRSHKGGGSRRWVGNLGAALLAAALLVTASAALGPRLLAESGSETGTDLGAAAPAPEAVATPGAPGGAGSPEQAKERPSPEASAERSPQTSSRVLQVSGEGIVRVEPDSAVINLAVETEASSAAEAQRLNAVQTQKVLAALEAQGVAKKEIATSGLHLYPIREYDERTRRDRQVGFRATHSLQVTVNRLDAVGALLDAAVAAGANSIQGITFQLQDEREARRQALEAAVADARFQAETLARAAGLQLGPILQMGDADVSLPIPRPLAAQPELFRAAAADLGAGAAIEPGTIQVTARVTMAFEIR